MRILQTILSKGFRGAERHVAELANAQARRHEVLLLLRRDCVDGNGVSIRDWLDPAVRVETLTRPFWSWKAWTTVRRFRPDVVHAHGGRASRLLPRVAGRVPVVSTIHLDYRHDSYKRVDGLICTTDWQRTGVSTGYQGRTARIDLWYRPQPRLTPDAVARERCALAGDGTGFLIGFVGHLIPAKGCDLLIEAFRRAALPDARLVVVGDGPERAALESTAPADVHFTGFRGDARNLFQAFDLFVSPSRDEPFGLVFLEALDAGTPIVATRSQGAMALLPGYPAELVALDDVDALAAALRHAHARRPPRYDADLSRFDQDGRLVEIEAFYRDVMETRASRS
ncbi:glycosyltransferase [Azospirillum canadense]|uniref:glycosyltransferase n=1 Tax=Azospirillum canadense TaxID=403962 RepID=UPI002226A4BA|nr:glycosyltransferase [Azospirillum canadense]MCW2236522.1 glycosyltransferase involved in cell wall biosynthesis [Azospirillum canadense]